MHKRTIVLIGLAVLVTILITGCGGGSPVSKSDRVSEFMSDISNASDFSGVGGNLHPDAAQYQQAQASSFWDTTFDTSTSYSISGLSISGDVGTANFVGGAYDNVIEFTFKNDPDSASGLFGGETDNYKIIRLELPQGSVVVE